MKLDASFLIVLMFIGTGAAAGYVVKSGIVYVPVLTDMARNSREQASTEHAWPPKVGEPYPELRLVSLAGAPLSLSSFRGKVLLIEPISMSCKACQSFSGADENDLGPFAPDRGGKHQPGLSSLETYAKRFAGVDFDDPRLVYVQVLFYGLEGKRPPTLEDANAWAKHFNLNRSNVVVAIADPNYVSQTTRAMIPSFQLVDQDFQLRFDAGKAPRQDLYKELLPAMKLLLDGKDLDAISTQNADSIEPTVQPKVDPHVGGHAVPATQAPTPNVGDSLPQPLEAEAEADFDKFEADQLPIVPEPVPAVPGVGGGERPAA